MFAPLIDGQGRYGGQLGGNTLPQDSRSSPQAFMTRSNAAGQGLIGRSNYVRQHTLSPAFFQLTPLGLVLDCNRQLPLSSIRRFQHTRHHLNILATLHDILLPDLESILPEFPYTYVRISSLRNKLRAKIPSLKRCRPRHQLHCLYKREYRGSQPPSNISLTFS